MQSATDLLKRSPSARPPVRLPRKLVQFDRAGKGIVERKDNVLDISGVLYK